MQEEASAPSYCSPPNKAERVARLRLVELASPEGMARPRKLGVRPHNSC
ncbi:hypothetical protein TIFTF001_017564 [Ficus carica]|uniref:Uncharacterized protein n=1 Tax=Ficus carica TaxID=3494 RepID=A0AA88DAU9_FICCA|nr:hypothetical protein TIFTF001_017564 [Ficus carica]